MSNQYGITTEGTQRTQNFTVWEGDFMSSPVGYGVMRHGATRTTITLLDYVGTKLKVSLPKGVTFPRTEGNYRDINAALSDALSAHYLESRGAPAACPHDDVEGDDNVPTNYTCRMCGDTWNGGAE